MVKLFHIVTYGCQMNVHESEKMAGILFDLGYSNTDNIQDADIIIFNTCCIRENAENHAFGNIGMLKQLKKAKKDMIIAVGGCMTQQMNKAENLIQKFPFVDIVFGTHNLHKIDELILKRHTQKKPVIEIVESDGTIFEQGYPLRSSFPNAWVNIMYGCNNFCTYCIVPYVRGRERSRNSDDVLTEVEEIIEDGYREITLLGQNVNSYGNDGGATMTFPQLLEEIANLDGDFRVRFMTSHPKDFSEDLVKVIAKYPKICKSIHLPAQSGSSAILKAMNRKYTVEEYLEKIEMIRKYIPDCSITTDLIVGFPGETEEDFEKTIELVKKVKYTSAFTFVYSKRQGTIAATMENQVPEEVSKRRIMKLIEVVNECTREHSSKYVGQVIEILVEDFDEKRQMYMGRDEYGRMGYFSSKYNHKGQFVKIKVEEANGISLFGTLI